MTYQEFRQSFFKLPLIIRRAAVAMRRGKANNIERQKAQTHLHEGCIRGRGAWGVTHTKRLSTTHPQPVNKQAYRVACFKHRYGIAA